MFRLVDLVGLARAASADVAYGYARTRPEEPGWVELFVGETPAAATLERVRAGLQARAPVALRIDVHPARRREFAAVDGSPAAARFEDVVPLSPGDAARLGALLAAFAPPRPCVEARVGERPDGGEVLLAVRLADGEAPRDARRLRGLGWRPGDDGFWEPPAG